MPFSKGLDQLSPRERQIIELAATGLTDRAIATALGISIGTLNTYWGRIRVKLGEVSRVELATRLTNQKASKTIDALRSQNAELLKTLNAMDNEADHQPSLVERARVLIDELPDALLIFDVEGTVCETNLEAETLLGYAPGTLLGVHLRQLIPARYHGWHAEQRHLYQASPEKRTMGTNDMSVALTQGGEEMQVVITMNMCRMLEGPRILCLLRPIK